MKYVIDIEKRTSSIKTYHVDAETKDDAVYEAIKLAKQDDSYDLLCVEYVPLYSGVAGEERM
jgi:hypothetical protein